MENTLPLVDDFLAAVEITRTATQNTETLMNKVNLVTLVDDCLAVVAGTKTVDAALAGQGIYGRIAPLKEDSCEEGLTESSLFLGIYELLPIVDLSHLIELLTHIDESDFVASFETYFCQSSCGGGGESFSQRDLLIDFATTVLADALLITSEGKCDWKNIDTVIEAGFDVFAGEQDSFGWLTGCIRTKKGIIVYG